MKDIIQFIGIIIGIFLCLNLLFAWVVGFDSIIGKIIKCIKSKFKRKKQEKGKLREVSLDLLPEKNMIRYINTGETEDEYIKRKKNEIKKIIKNSFDYGYSFKNMKENGIVRKKSDGVYVYYKIIGSYDAKLIPFYHAGDIEDFFKSHGKIIGFKNGMKFTDFIKIFDIKI